MSALVRPRLLALVKQFEGFRAHAYQDAAGVWTIGYGTTRGVRAGQTITKEEATAQLEQDLIAAGAAVVRAVKIPLFPHEFDALSSFVYNVGAAAFTRSTLLKRLNTGDRDLRAEFLKWVHVKGRPLRGLRRRRRAEADLFAGKASVMATPTR